MTFTTYINMLSLFHPMQSFLPWSVFCPSLPLASWQNALQVSRGLEWTDPSICWPFEMISVFQSLICSSYLGSCMNNKLTKSEQWDILKLLYVCIFKAIHKKKLGYYWSSGCITVLSIQREYKVKSGRESYPFRAHPFKMWVVMTDFS